MMGNKWKRKCARCKTYFLVDNGMQTICKDCLPKFRQKEDEKVTT